MPELQRLLTQARRISEHRTKEAEGEIRRVYQNLLKDRRAFVAGEYERFAVDDRLDFSILQQKGEFARFLEETQKIVNAHEPEVKREVRDIIEQTYARCWRDFQEAVGKSADSAALRDALRGVRGVTPEVVKRAVINPVSGLTLNDRLEKHRQEVIYNIKQQLGTGLTQGDRYSTMARRVAGEVEGNYKKAVRIVRTETHRVREAGFHDSALEVDSAARAAGLQMVKTWRTMKDERVRPNARYRTKSGWKTVRRGPADHQKMEGVSVPVDQEFDLGGGVKAKAPGQSGVAGQDINCRCFLEYGMKPLQSPENGDILNTVNIEYLPVTGESINRVALVESRFLSPENNRKLQESHQSLLRVVMDQPVGTEAFRAYDSEMGLLDSRIGMLGKVKVPRFNQNYIVIHNHPSGETFSMGDVTAFLANDKLRMMTAVGNDGSVYLFEKVGDSNVNGFNKFRKALQGLHPGYDRDPEAYVDFMEKLLEGAKRYGFQYKKG